MNYRESAMQVISELPQNVQPANNTECNLSHDITGRPSTTGTNIPNTEDGH